MAPPEAPVPVAEFPESVVSVTDQLQDGGFEKVSIAAQNADEE